MQRLSTQIFAVIFLIAAVISAHASQRDTDTRILMVVSGYGQAQGKEKPGFEFDEFAKAFLMFKTNGIAVDVASPKGGAVEADEYDPNKAFNTEVLADKSIMSKLNNTLVLRDLSAEHYAGVFVVGGKAFP